MWRRPVKFYIEFASPYGYVELTRLTQTLARRIGRYLERPCASPSHRSPAAVPPALRTPAAPFGRYSTD